MRVTRGRTVITAAFAALAIGSTVGVVVGSSTHLFGDGDTANAATTTPTASATVEVPAAEAPLEEGAIRIDQDIDQMSGPVQLSKIRTQDGAAAAFASYAAWVISSPAAKREPSLAVQAIGADTLNNADAELLRGMKRAPDDNFQVAQGAYRVLGHAGADERPDQVMVEIAAPLSVGGNERWSIVGGVVKWTADGWTVASLRPREIEDADSDSASDLTAEERAGTLPGLGWRLIRAGA